MTPAQLARAGIATFQRPTQDHPMPWCAERVRDGVTYHACGDNERDAVRNLLVVLATR